jgi:putative membrane protein
MNDSPYERFASDDLILRDELAIDRTLLANERTLLAYLRSGVTLLIAGVSIMHFSPGGWFWMVGLTCIPTGLIAGIVGVARYRKMNRSISLVRQQSQMKKSEDAEPNLGTLPRARGGHAEVRG